MLSRSATCHLPNSRKRHRQKAQARPDEAPTPKFLPVRDEGRGGGAEGGDGLSSASAGEDIVRRQAAGPGWALVGYAGVTTDPLTAGGIFNAFRDAGLLSQAIHERLSGSKRSTRPSLASERSAMRSPFPSSSSHATRRGSPRRCRQRGPDVRAARPAGRDRRLIRRLRPDGPGRTVLRSRQRGADHRRRSEAACGLVARRWVLVCRFEHPRLDTSVGACRSRGRSRQSRMPLSSNIDWLRSGLDSALATVGRSSLRPVLAARARPWTVLSLRRRAARQPPVSPCPEGRVK
jgi:hypothetical protein